jgi:hypothetical protein
VSVLSSHYSQGRARMPKEEESPKAGARESRILINVSRSEVPFPQALCPVKAKASMAFRVSKHAAS